MRSRLCCVRGGWARDQVEVEIELDIEKIIFAGEQYPIVVNN